MEKNTNYIIGESALRAAGLDPNRLEQYADKPNEFFNQIQNKVIAQYVLQTLKYENPYTKYFKRSALTIGDGIEVLMVNPWTPIDYDASKYVPDGSEIKKDVKTQIIYTTDRKVFEYSLSRPIIMAAFSSIERLGQFISEYTRMLQQSVELWLWNKISKDLSNIKNIITLKKGTKDEEAFLKILTTSNYMTNPSTEFNVDGSKWKVNATPKNRQLLLTNPVNEATWRFKIFANMYNIATLTPSENFADVITTTNLSDDDYAYIVDTDAYYIDFRIENFVAQDFAKNMENYNALHLWVRSGLLQNANGVKIQIAKT